MPDSSQPWNRIKARDLRVGDFVVRGEYRGQITALSVEGYEYTHPKRVEILVQLGWNRFLPMTCHPEETVWRQKPEEHTNAN